VCWWEFGDSDIRSCFVCLKGFIGAIFALVSEGEFGEVAVIISLPTNKWCPTEETDKPGYPERHAIRVNSEGDIAKYPRAEKTRREWIKGNKGTYIL
jgi:hypothetical protein